MGTRRAWVELGQPSDKQEIIEEVGDISQVEVMYNQILVGIWKRPEKTKGGIILTDNTRKEDDYQGKVGLVLKCGPSAFQSTDEMDFGTQSVQVGDWVVFRPGDGWQLKVGDRPCRMLVDASIKLKIPKPEMVY
jgi:co-chaperonin GroES (HSP10)